MRTERKKTSLSEVIAKAARRRRHFRMIPQCMDGNMHLKTVKETSFLTQRTSLAKPVVFRECNSMTREHLSISENISDYHNGRRNAPEI